MPYLTFGNFEEHVVITGASSIYNKKFERQLRLDQQINFCFLIVTLYSYRVDMDFK